MFTAATSPKFRESLTCQECLSQQHLVSRCPFSFPLLGHRKSKVSPQGPRANGIISPRRNESIERALVNPEKSARIPTEGLQLKFVFG